MKTKTITTIILTLLLVSMLSIAFVAPAAATEVTDLVGQWHLDQEFGTALEFDGVDDYVGVSFSSSLDFTALGQDFTAEAWVNVAVLKDYDLIFQQEDSGVKGRSWLYIRANGALRSYIGGTETETVGGLITVGSWHHVALTFDKDPGSQTGTLKLYVDGVEEASSTRTFVPSTGDYRIGIHKSDIYSFNGIIDEVRISDVARTSFYLCGAHDPIFPNTVALWQFDEGSGSTAFDSSGTNDGTLMDNGGTGDGTANGPIWVDSTLAIDSSCNGNFGTIYGATWVDALFGKALSFDGDDYVYVQDSDSLDVTMVTLEAWIKPSMATQTGYARVIFKGNDHPDVAYFLAYDGTGKYMRMRVYIGSSGITATSTTQITDTSKWYHIVGTYDGSEVRIYIDGVEEGTSSTTGDVDIGSQDLGIGRNAGANKYGFKGLIDEARVWSSALSAEEIKKHTWGLVGEWDFNENGGSKAYDSSGFGNDGTLLPTSSEPTWVGGRTGGVTDYALNFDGVDDYVEIEDDDSLDITDSITLEAWIKRTKGDEYQGIVAKYQHAGNQRSYLLYLDPSNKLRMFVSDDGSQTSREWVDSTEIIPHNEWVHVAGTFDGTDLKLYINGEDKTGTTHDGASIIYSGTAPVLIGSLDYTAIFGGMIDEVRVWNQALVPVTFDQIGLDDTAVGIVVTVSDPIDLEFDDLPYIMMVPSGTSIDYTYTDPVPGGSGKQFILDSVSGDSSPVTVDEPKTIIGNYVTQYEVTFYASGLGDDATPSHIVLSVDVDYPSSVDYLRTEDGLDGGFSIWVDDGIVIGYNYDAPIPSTVPGKRYLWVSTIGTGSVVGPIPQEGPNAYFTVTEATTITTTYSIQYEVTFYDLGLGDDATGTVVEVDVGDDASVEYVLNEDDLDPGYNIWVDDGVDVSYEYMTPVSVDSGKQYRWDSTSGTGSASGVADDELGSFTVTSAATVTGDYVTQFYLTVQTDPLAIVTIPGEGWYDEGTSKLLTALPVSGYTFLNWDVDGPSQGDGVNPITVNMNAPHTATAHYFTWFTVSGYKYEYLGSFYDDFDDEDYDGWTVDSGTWSASGGILSGSSSGTEEAWIWSDQYFSGDIVVEFDMKFLTTPSDVVGKHGGIMSFAQDQTNRKSTSGYVIDWIDRESDRGFRFTRFDSGTPNRLDEIDGSIVEGEWYHWKVVKQDDTIWLYIDGTFIGSVTDPGVPYTSGYVGFWLYKNNQQALFDNVCVMDITEPLEGWTIKLLDESDIEITSDITDSNGYYEMIVEDPGSYKIVEELQAHWTAIKPVPMVGPEVDTIDVVGYTFDAESGKNVPCRDFWNFEWLTVSGHKYLDFDGRQPTSVPLGDWTIRLYKDTDLYDETTTEGSDGSYSFTIMDPGSYEIREMLKAGWTKTAPPSMVTGDPVIDMEVLCYDLGDVTSGTDLADKDIWNFEWFSIVTTSSYCPFDWNDETEENREFRLIFTPDLPDNIQLYKLSASNPGQFMYNIFYAGDYDTGDVFTISLPYPFATQGANPIHVYDSWTLNSDPCLIEGNDISSEFDIATIGEFQFSVTPTSDDNSGFLWITVHVDYDLKKTHEWDKGILGLNDVTGPSGVIMDNTEYEFEVAGLVTDEDSIYNLNVFKRVPGFAGLVQDSGSNPMAGVMVDISGSGLIVQVVTDVDGWYCYTYKHKGKPQDYTVTLHDYPSYSKTVTLKANHLEIVDFLNVS